MQKENKVDWEWANALPSLSICDAVTLSLGYELMSFAPVDWQIDRPTLDAPPEYVQRVSLTYEHARSDKLKRTGRTASIDEPYNQDAEFIDGQFWEIDLADFRRFCDKKKWAVPAEFLPDEYAASQSQKYPDASAIIGIVGNCTRASVIQGPMENIMSKYTIKYACGHGDFEENLVGKVSDRQGRADWLANNKVCPDCYKAIKASEEAAAPKNAKIVLITASDPVIAIEVTGQIDCSKDALQK